MKRGGVNLAPEVAPQDLESPSGPPKFNQSQMISMAGRPNIQPYEAGEKKIHGRGSRSMDSEGMQKVAMAVGGIWLIGVFLGYDYLWPLYLILNIIYSILNTPPFSWIFGWIWTPVSWIFGWAYRGAPLVEQSGALQEMRLPSDQVPSFVDQYVQQYGDAALIFATHDGYPQIVNSLLYNRDLGYSDLLDATDDSGNTALIYAASKGFRQCTAALLRHGADPDISNQGGGGRTPLMEAAGGGHKDIVAAIRLSNATIDTVDDFGNTALHYAAYHGHLSTVHELLKSNPRKDITNSYGHTAASYAASNKHKAIADLLNRAPTKRELALQEKAEKAEKQKEKDPADDMEDLGDLESLVNARKSKKVEEPKHVKGKAEDLHKQDKDFAPTIERMVNGVSDSERKALEDQVAKLRRQHEEYELKSQKRIVELLEKSSNHQKAVDDAERELRAYQLNQTELLMKVKDFESRHQSLELRVNDEKDRAERLNEEVKQIHFEVDRHKNRAEGAEKERDLHMDAAKRHEENLRKKHEEVSDYLQRLETQSKEMQKLRDDLKRKEEELRSHQQKLEELSRGSSPTGSSSADQPKKEAPSSPAAPDTTASTDTSTKAPEPETPSAGAASVPAQVPSEQDQKGGAAQS